MPSSGDNNIKPKLKNKKNKKKIKLPLAKFFPQQQHSTTVKRLNFPIYMHYSPWQCAVQKKSLTFKTSFKITQLKAVMAFQNTLYPHSLTSVRGRNGHSLKSPCPAPALAKKLNPSKISQRLSRISWSVLQPHNGPLSRIVMSEVTKSKERLGPVLTLTEGHS